jgi:uncharacterized protein
VLVHPSPDPDAPRRVGPLANRDRLPALDALRGVSILGVLVAYTVWSLGNPPEQTWTRADAVTALLMDLFVDNKFVTMFACLFGVGVSQQWRRWADGRENLVPLHLRRMGFLLVVGLLHACLLRNGDILAPYALLGVLLLLVRDWPMRTLLALVVVLTIAAPVAEAIRVSMGWQWPARPDTTRITSFVAENLMWVRYWYTTNPVLSWPRIFALMLIGLLIERAGLIARLSSERGFAVRVAITALTAAIVVRLAMIGLWPAMPGPSPRSPAGIALGTFYQVSAWPLSAAYAAIVFVCWQSAGTQALLRPLTFVGRMAFTNYLSQAMIAVPVCLACGLFDHVTPTGGAVMAIAIALLQLLFSSYWLSLHAMGPFERIWRRGTYGEAGRQN